jgi:hypothetical protein
MPLQGLNGAQADPYGTGADARVPDGSRVTERRVLLVLGSVKDSSRPLDVGNHCVIVGAEGFSSTNEIAIILAWVFDLAWILGLLIIAWRMRDFADSRPSRASVGEEAPSR